jgi:predicted nucleic acid-binding protein
MNASGSFFFDTNVLLYCFDTASSAKQACAQQWVGATWPAGRARCSWQVLNEFYANAVRKMGVPAAEARAAVEDVSVWPMEPWSMELLRRAWRWADTAKLSFWDSMILAAAEQGGSRWLLSEDFQAGRKFGAVTVVNPFVQLPEEFGLSQPDAE